MWVPLESVQQYNNMGTFKYLGYIAPMMQNQMEKKVENEMETGIIAIFCMF